MQVKYLNLKKQFVSYDIRAVVNELVAGCQFVLGPQVERFEKAFAEYCEVPYALGVNSGTDALFLALRVLGIGPQDEVITAPNSFLATAASIANVGAKPVFVDVADDYNINPDLIETAITSKTKAIMPVHLTGNPAVMDKIMAIARKHALAIIEDAAQAVGATFNGKRVGSFGVGCFSLHPLKNLNACGDGGIITTSSKDLYEKLRQLRNHGLVNRDESVRFGYCSRLDSFQAAIVSIGLSKIEGINKKRNENAAYYDKLFAGMRKFVTLPPRCVKSYQVYHTYIIQVERRKELIAYLSTKDVETKIHYPIPIHLQKAAEYLGHKKGDFPVCELQSERILTLPIHQFLARDEQDYVAATIREFYERR
ncbi:MAG: DegT/DnrJ/EryC1/StrS family aminotransferase [Kiritimatiellae bacterium]|nr:DegT/DnrJ/EryC1/StrS family aminotransferase [Kiritimatiellia bacterium]